MDAGLEVHPRPACAPPRSAATRRHGPGICIAFPRRPKAAAHRGNRHGARRRADRHGDLSFHLGSRVLRLCRTRHDGAWRLEAVCPLHRVELPVPGRRQPVPRACQGHPLARLPHPPRHGRRCGAGDFGRHLHCRAWRLHLFRHPARDRAGEPAWAGIPAAAGAGHACRGSSGDGNAFLCARGNVRSPLVVVARPFADGSALQRLRARFPMVRRSAGRHRLLRSSPRISDCSSGSPG